MSKTYAHEEVCNWSVRFAFTNVWGPSGFGKAGRVVSGLLKAAEKAGEIKATRTYGRVSGDAVFYSMTEEQLETIRAKAIARTA
jgi:hypothetical protein